VSRHSRGLACLLAAIALFTSCGGGGDDASAPPDSGVEGVVLTGPTCAVQRVPPDPDCDDRLLAHASVRAKQGDRLVGETETDAQGRFRLPLAPGDYQLFTSGGINPSDTPVATAHVAANRFTQVELYVDTGIR
jgi:hypothetical protein